MPDHPTYDQLVTLPAFAVQPVPIAFEDNNGQLNVRSDVNVAILKALRAHGIDIPYPQRVVHLQAPPAAPVAPAATSSSTEATG